MVLFFLFLISLPSAPDLALGKDLIFFLILCRASQIWRSAKNFLKKILCRVPLGRHSAKI